MDVIRDYEDYLRDLREFKLCYDGFRTIFICDEHLLVNSVYYDIFRQMVASLLWGILNDLSVIMNLSLVSVNVPPLA